MRTVPVSALQWSIAAWFTLAAASTSLAQPANLGFEDGELGRPPAGWFLPAPCAAAGYTAALSAEDPREGERCAVLARPVAKEDGFGNLVQSFDARPYRGQRVLLGAAVSAAVQGRGNQAQLWLRVDREGGKPGFFDNMADRPIVQAAWAEYVIAGKVADDAVSISIGCMLIGTGSVRLDAVTFRVAGPADGGDEPPRPIEGRALDNLVAFTRLFGYVRYFYPGDEAAAASWEAVALDGVAPVEEARDAAALAAALERRFRPLAPALRVFPTGKAPRAAPPRAPTGAADVQVTEWRHLGVDGGEKVPQPIYSSVRRRVPAPGGKAPAGARDPQKLFRADLGGGVSCSLPLSLYVVEGKTWPRADATPVEPGRTRPRPPGFRPSGNDRDTRIGAVIIAWNVFQHFYPYFDAFGPGGIDWPAALREALATAAVDGDERAFLDTLRRMVARLRDGHGNVWHSSDAATSVPPIRWDWIERGLVITYVQSGLERPAPGDLVLSLDGKPAGLALEDAERLISGATPQWLRWSALNAVLRGESGSELTLELQPLRGDAYTLKLRRELQPGALAEPRPPPIHEVKPGFYYVDIERIDDEAFASALEKLRAATGIVVDFRGYPSKMPLSVLSHWMRQRGTSPAWNVPLVTQPDRQGLTFETSNWPVVPAAPRLAAKVAFVTDGRAISAAETMLGIVEQYKLGAIVGGPTAGTNGNANPFRLPGGYRVAWTGMKVLKHDGSRHHGVGILPTVPVARTRKGVAAGRDELLERALEQVGCRR